MFLSSIGLNVFTESRYRWTWTQRKRGREGGRERPADLWMTLASLRQTGTDPDTVAFKIVAFVPGLEQKQLQPQHEPIIYWRNYFMLLFLRFHRSHCPLFHRESFFHWESRTNVLGKLFSPLIIIIILLSLATSIFTSICITYKCLRQIFVCVWTSVCEQKVDFNVKLTDQLINFCRPRLLNPHDALHSLSL